MREAVDDVNKWTITLEKTEWDDPTVLDGGYHVLYNVPEDHLVPVFEDIVAMLTRST